MTNHTKLLDQIDAFLAESEMSATTLGRKSVNDGKFVARIRSGRRCWPETERKVLDFIAVWRATARQKDAAA